MISDMRILYSYEVTPGIKCKANCSHSLTFQKLVTFNHGIEESKPKNEAQNNNNKRDEDQPVYKPRKRSFWNSSNLVDHKNQEQTHEDQQNEGKGHLNHDTSSKDWPSKGIP